jgi:hypothetical protein
MNQQASSSLLPPLPPANHHPLNLPLTNGYMNQSNKNSSLPLLYATSNQSHATHQMHHQQHTFEIRAHLKDELLLNMISIIDCIIILFGTIGNLTSFYLLTRKRLRPVSSMRYLAALTLVDTICLYGWYLSSVYRQLSGEHVKRLENINAFMCKFISYISFSSLQLSSVLLCMLTIDRLFIIISSMWRSKYANPIFANRIIICIFVAVLLLNSVIPIKMGNRGYVNYIIRHVGDTNSSMNHATGSAALSGGAAIQSLPSINFEAKDANSINNSGNSKEATAAAASLPLFTSEDHLDPAGFYVHSEKPLGMGGDAELEYALNPADSVIGTGGATSISAGNEKYAARPQLPMNLSMYYCYDDNNKLLKVWNRLHLYIYSLVPFPILCILNLTVIYLTREAAVSAANLNSNMKKIKNGQQFVTRLLLFLTLSFLLTTLPSTIVYAYWHTQILEIRFGRVFLNLLNTLQFSRHSSNWIIYVYSSSFMREEFKKCIACADSEYELAEAVLVDRPSVAVEILRQLELNNTTMADQDYFNSYYYYGYNENSKKNSKSAKSSFFTSKKADQKDQTNNGGDSNARENNRIGIGNNKINNSNSIDYSKSYSESTSNYQNQVRVSIASTSDGPSKSGSNVKRVRIKFKKSDKKKSEKEEIKKNNQIEHSVKNKIEANKNTNNSNLDRIIKDDNSKDKSNNPIVQ